MLTRRALALAPLLGLLLGCGTTKDVGNPGDLDGGSEGGLQTDAGDGGGETPASLDGLDLDPLNSVVVIDTTATPAKPAVQTYKVSYVAKDGTVKDVSGTATMTVDDTALGSFAGTTFTSTDKLPSGVKGLTTIVRASADGRATATNLTIIALRRAADAPGTGDFFFTVPYLGKPSPDKDVLKFGTNIKQVDVAFLMDTTGSMGGQIDGLKKSLSTTIIPALTKAIPSVGMAIAYHDDYPLDPYGDPGCDGLLPGDLPVGVIQIVTTDVAKAQAAANKLETHCGNDGPEAQIPAMQHLLTGETLTWPGGSVPAHKPAAGTTGGVDFRPGALPVVAEITDIEWHDTTVDPYSFKTPVMSTLKAAFLKSNARFVELMAEGGDETQANDLADATKSLLPPSAFGACKSGSGCCTDVGGAGRAATGPGGTCRLNFLYSCSFGSTCDVTTGIVTAIKAISAGSVFDVTATWSNDPANPPLEAGGPPVDAAKFIKALRAMNEGNASAGCPAATTKDTDGDGVDDTFVGVKVGVPVCFEVIPQSNTTVPPKTVAQFYNAFIDVIGMPGAVKLDQRAVLFLVPPTDVPR